MKFSAPQPFQWIASHHLISSGIPNHHRARPIAAFRNGSFEIRIVKRVVLDFYREAAVASAGGNTLWHGPGFEHAFHFQTKVIMQSGRVMLLHNKERRLSLNTSTGFP